MNRFSLFIIMAFMFAILCPALSQDSGNDYSYQGSFLEAETDFNYIKGSIKDNYDKRGVSGAFVQLDNGALSVFSNAQGDFYIFGATAGAHKIRVWESAYEILETNVNVAANQITTVNPIYIKRRTGTVMGRILDNKTNEPIAAATVQLDGGDKWRTLTDSEGRFRLLAVDAGPHKLQTWGYAYNFQEKNINVAHNTFTQLDDAKIGIIPDTIRGQIIDEQSERPLMDAVVQFDGGGAGRQTITNSAGRFIIPFVPAGQHELQVWGWAYQFKTKSFSQFSGVATDLKQITLSPQGGTVNGRIIDAVNGLPVYNATAQLNGGNYFPWKRLTNLNGDFILYNVSLGTYQFQSWGYAYRYQPIWIVAGESNNSLGDIKLIPDPNTFNGRVLDAGTHLPISGAEVILTGGGIEITTHSFPDGRFVLLNVPEGVFDITATADDHSLVFIKAAHPGKNANVELGDFPLP